MDSKSDQPDLLTVVEVTEALRLGRTRVNELLWTGALPSIKVGRRRLIRRSDLTRFVEEHEYRLGED